MNPEDISFEEFFADRVKQKGLTIKKLADTTGISPRHLQDIARGDFAALPSAPYVRGYLIKLGEVLDFDGDDWWQRIKSERRIKNSGATDSLPENRFLKNPPTKLIAVCVVLAIIVIYFVVQSSKIFGRPSLTITNPGGNPSTAMENPITVAGTAKNTDMLSIDGENVSVAPDGTWQKDVLLSDGPNEITITAKKFLGGTANVTEEIIYQAPVATTTATSTDVGDVVPTSSATTSKP